MGAEPQRFECIAPGYGVEDKARDSRSSLLAERAMRGRKRRRRTFFSSFFRKRIDKERWV